MNRVLFFDTCGIPQIPNKQFKDLQDAEQYANSHDLKIGYKLDNFGKDDLVQSIEFYKGFTLIVYLYNLDSSHPLKMHRNCDLYVEGKSIASAKTKKELKDLINHGMYDKYLKNKTVAVKKSPTDIC